MRAFSFALLFSLLVTGLEAYPQELLTNNSFESGSSGWTNGWYPFDAGVQILNGKAHSGTYGLWSYTNTSTAMSFAETFQDVTAAPGERFTASAWVRTGPVSPGGGTWVTGASAFIRVRFTNSSGSLLGEYDSAKLTAAGSPWQQLSVTTPAAPAGTSNIRFWLRVEKAAGPSGQAVANFDECSLVKTAAPAAEMVLSSRVVSLGESASQAGISISNSGSGILSWQINESTSWLTVSPASGTTTSGSDSVVFTVNRSGLSLETYHAVVSVTSNGGNADVDVYMENPRSYAVPGSPSIVSTDGYRLLVRRRLPSGQLDISQPYTIKGAAYSPASVGTAPDQNSRQAEYARWYQTDFAMLREMNANTVYTFLDFGTGISATQILDNLYNNNLMAIITVDWDGTWDTGRISDVVTAYKNHPAVLMWAIGNEWNINLYHNKFGSLSAAATATQQAAQQVKNLDPNHPVASIFGEINIPNANPSTSQIVNTICPAVDVWGLNIYRGNGFGALFDEWKAISGKPMFLSEFGTDSYHATSWYPVAGYEDESAQSSFVAAAWNDLAGELSANDPAKVSLGGTVFEWVDEWWKVQNGGDPNVRDNGGFASTWNPGAHPDGFANEEYFGIVRIDRTKKPLYDSLATAFSYNLLLNPPYRTVNSSPNSNGAAVAESILDYVRNGLASDLNQSQIYTYGHQYNSSENSALAELDPKGMSYVLGHFDPYDSLVTGTGDNLDSNPNGNPQQGYNYGVVSVQASQTDALPLYMQDIAKWISYTVPQRALDPQSPLCAVPQVPAAVPIYGGYHWVVIKGVVSSTNACPAPLTNPWYTPPVTVKGFWISDPQGGAIGTETYKTAAECEQTYFKPLQTGDSFAGKYVTVAEPPDKKDVRAVRLESLKPSSENLDYVQYLDLVETAPALFAGKPRRQITWQSLVDPVFRENPAVSAALKGAKTGRPVLVKRLDDSRFNYWLVPIGSKTGTGINYVNAVILLDKKTGAFREASWSPKKAVFLPLIAERAIKLVKTKYAKELKAISKSLKGSVKKPTATLVWRPGLTSSSPYEPWWQVDISTKSVIVRQNGKVGPLNKAS